MQKIVLWLEHALNIDQSTIYKILSTLLILFIGWVIYRFIHAAIGNRFRNMDLRYQWHKATEYYPLKYDKLTPIVYTSVRENGVQLTVRYLYHPRARRGSTQYFWEGILAAFAENPNIQFTYPTQRFVSNPINIAEQCQS